MKNILIYILIAGSFIITSCNTADSDGVSNITNYATFTYESEIAIPLGGTFTPNATATEGGKSIDVKNTGSVDTNTVGAYTITYSAENSDGFPARVQQTVIIHDPSITGTNISGNIQDKGRNERKAVISLVKGTTSIFYVTDFAFGGTFPMYVQMNGDAISAIPQPYVFGVTSVDLTYNSTSKEFTTKVNPQGFEYAFEYEN